MYGIIGAMEIETAGLVERMSAPKTIWAGAYGFTVGSIDGVETVVCRCGIGKVFSSTAAALMIEKFGVEGIVSIGVAGGAKPLRQGDIVVAERTVQHDYDAVADGKLPGQVHGFDSPYFSCDPGAAAALFSAAETLGYPVAKGTIATGDCFVSGAEKSNAIARAFGACAFDMESAAINQVCAVQGVKFCSMRAISDNGDDEAVASFYEFVNEAARRSIEVIVRFLKSASGK